MLSSERELSQVPVRAQSDGLKELRHRLRSMRADIAQLKNPALNDMDALLSVAEAELARAIGDREQSEGGSASARPST